MQTLTLQVTEYEVEALRRRARKSILRVEPLDLETLAGVARRCVIDLLVMEAEITEEALYNEAEAEREAIIEQKKAEAEAIAKRLRDEQVVADFRAKRAEEETKPKKKKKRREVIEAEAPKQAADLTIPNELHGGLVTAGYALWQWLIVESLDRGKWQAFSVAAGAEAVRRKEKTVYTAVTRLTIDGWLLESGRESGVAYYRFTEAAQKWIIAKQADLVEQGIIEEAKEPEQLPPLYR